MESERVCTRRHRWKRELAQISSLTELEGFWVARIRWTPSERPTREALTSSRMKSGCSLFSSANSSTMMIRWGSLISLGSEPNI